jgi:hypothetical protein
MKTEIESFFQDVEIITKTLAANSGLKTTGSVNIPIDFEGTEEEWDRMLEYIGKTWKRNNDFTFHINGIDVRLLANSFINSY